MKKRDRNKRPPTSLSQDEINALIGEWRAGNTKEAPDWDNPQAIEAFLENLPPKTAREKRP